MKLTTAGTIALKGMDGFQMGRKRDASCFEEDYPARSIHQAAASLKNTLVDIEMTAVRAPDDQV